MSACRWSLVACFVAAGLVAPHALAQGARLSPPLAPESIGAAGAYVTSADGTRVVYTASQNGPQVELFVVPADGSGPSVRLSGSPAPLSFVSHFRLSPDESRIVFAADRAVLGQYELYSVPSDGSAAPVRLSPDLPSGGDVLEAKISSDSSRVAFRADGVADEVVQLYSAPIDGSQPAVLLSGTPVAGGDVHRAWIAPDSGSVLYLADELTDERDELFSVPLDGSAAPTHLSSSTSSVLGRGGSGSDKTEPKISADSSWAVYLTFPGGCLAVPLDGSDVPHALGGSFVSGGNVTEFRLSADAVDAVYSADQEIDGVQRLYSTPIATSATATTLNAPPATAGEVVTGFWVGPGSSVLYRATSSGGSVNGLFVRAIDAGAPSVQLASSGVSVMAAPFSPDGTRVTFTGAALMSAPVDGSQPAIAIGTGFPVAYHPASGGVVSRTITGGTVWTQQQDLFLAPLDGSSPAVLLVDGEPGDDLIFVSAAGDSVFLCRFRNVPLGQAFSVIQEVSADGGEPARDVHPALATGPTQKDVQSFERTPDGRWVVLTGDLRLDNILELYAAPSDGTGRPRRLADWMVSASQRLRFSGDSRRVILRLPQFFTEDPSDYGVHYLLSSLSIDGTGPAVAFETVPNIVTDRFEVTPDGNRVLFVRGSAYPHTYAVCVAPVDGSTPTAVLDGLTGPGPLVATATRAVYADGGTTMELRSMPLDGSTTPIVLHGSAFVGSELLISPDQTRVVYRVASGTAQNLWSVPVDGSAAPVQLNGPLVSGGSVSSIGDVVITPDGTRVLYLADQDVNNRFELFSVPIAGGTPVRLNGALVGARDVTGFRIAADGLVLYRANQTTASRFDLYSVPSDGSAAAVRLSVGGTGNVASLHFDFDANGPDAVYLFDESSTRNLYAVTRGGGTPRKLNPGGTVSDFVLHPLTSSVVFVANLINPSTSELYRMPLDGSRPPQLVSPSGAGSGHLGILAFDLGPEAHEAVYIGDRVQEDVFELWRSPLEKHRATDVPPRFR